VIDGSAVGVLDRPMNLVRKGIFNKVPAIFGSNENDGSYFVLLGYVVSNMSVPISDKNVYDLLYHFYPNVTSVESILQAYPSASYFDNYNRVAIILRDLIFRCNIRAFIRSIRVLAGEGDAPTWLYRFNMTLSSPEGELFGDFHSAEIPFVFNNARPYWNATDITLSNQMGCYWSSMAIHGDPNLSACDNVIEWPENTGMNGDFNIAFDSELRTETGLSEAQCDFWDSIGYN
jgi:carboxylesterase type B